MSPFKREKRKLWSSRAELQLEANPAALSLQLFPCSSELLFHLCL